MADREKLVELLDYSWQMAKSECNKFPRNCLGCPKKSEREDGRECLESLFIDHLIANGVVVREAEGAGKETGALRVEITTDDFEDQALARDRGWHRRHYFCPGCGQELKHEIYENEHCFGSWSAVSEEIMMNFCPNCGAAVRGEGG